MTEDIRTQIRTFLQRFFRHIELADDQNIFELGFVNSLFAMQLVLFIEKEFDLTIESEELDLANFQTIDAMVNLINSKKQYAHRG